MSPSVSNLPYLSRTDSTPRMPLSDFDRLLRNSCTFTSRDNLTPANLSPSTSALELFVSRGSKTMQLSVEGFTERELAHLVSELGMKEVIP